ncbi:MAG: hypothetical protein HY066_07300 [Betaproteobacteria bacterium]|nr:hypothetical protein [Betaproteobacteria bacterium]
MSEPTSQPYFSADFGEHGGRFDWMSHDEIVGWIGQLQNQWIWVGQQQHNPTRSAWQTIVDNLNRATQALTHANNHRNQGQVPQADAQLESARSTLESFIRSNPWLLPNNARRSFVESLRDSGQPLDAALIVAYWMQQDLNGAPIKSVVIGLLQWELYERGIKDRMKTENASLKRLAGEMQTTLTEYEEAERTQTTRFEDLHAQLTDQSATQQNTFDTTQQNRDTEWKKQIDDTQAELNRLKETYDKHMALAAPVEYWDGKRKKHGRWTIWSFITIVICMLSFGYLLHTELQGVGQAVMASKVAPSAANTQQAVASTQSLVESAATWRLGSFILLATLGFWFIRLLVRVFLSNLHLENDAAERVTMAKTYLALIRDDALPRGENINTVLAALFRPTGDGIVKDEGLPPTAMEWITKLGGK